MAEYPIISIVNLINQMNTESQQFLELTPNLSISLDQIQDESLIQLLKDVMMERGYHPLFSYYKFYLIQKKRSKYSIKHSQHSISDIGAINMIWKCLARQIGIPPLHYDLNTINKQLENYLQKIQDQLSIQPDKNSITKPKRLEQKKQLQQLRQIQTQIFQIIQTSIMNKRNQVLLQESYNNQIIINFLEDKILQIQRRIFCKSVIAVKTSSYKFDDQVPEVQILLEQSYPHIKLSSVLAKHLLGQKLFENKIRSYETYEKMYEQNHRNTILTCHICMEPIQLNKNPMTCDNKLAVLDVPPCINTDPYLYKQRCLEEFSCLLPTKNKPCPFFKIDSYIYPYLRYYKSTKNKTICGRYFCQKCQQIQNKIYLEEGSTSCSYCEGLCNCMRCSQTDILVSLMGIFNQRGGNLKQLVKKFAFQLVLLQNKINVPDISQQDMDQIKQIVEEFIQHKIFRQIIQTEPNRQTQLEQGQTVMENKLKKIYYFPEKFEPYSIKMYKKLKKRFIKRKQTPNRRARKRIREQIKFVRQYTRKLEIQEENQIQQAKNNEQSYQSSSNTPIFRALDLGNCF